MSPDPKAEYQNWHINPTDLAYFSDSNDANASGTFRSEKIYLGSGNDRLVMSAGQDKVDGGAGRDIVTAQKAAYDALPDDIRTVAQLMTQGGLDVVHDETNRVDRISFSDQNGSVTQEYKSVEEFLLTDLADRVTVLASSDASGSTGRPIVFDGGLAGDTFVVDASNGSPSVILIGGGGNDTFEFTGSASITDSNGSPTTAPKVMVVYGGEGQDTFKLSKSMNVAFVKISDVSTIPDLDLDQIRTRLGIKDGPRATVVIVNADQDDVITWEGQTLSGATAQILQHDQRPIADKYAIWNYGWQGTQDLSGAYDRLFPTVLQKEDYDFYQVGFKQGDVKYFLGTPGAVGSSSLLLSDLATSTSLYVTGFQEGVAGISFHDYVGEIPKQKMIEYFWDIGDYTTAHNLDYYFGSYTSFADGANYYNGPINFGAFEEVYVSPIIDRWSARAPYLEPGNGDPAWKPIDPGFNDDHRVSIDGLLLKSDPDYFAVDGTDQSDIVTGSTSNNNIYGYDGDDTLKGLAGDDMLDGGPGADSLDGGDGVDTASYFSSASGIVLDRVTPASSTGDAAGDKFVSVEAFGLSMYSDVFNGLSAGETVHGDDGDDVIFGNDGNDTLFGDAGNDSLTGGRGNDKVDGGTGDDVIFSGDGDDTLDGGDGFDRVSFASATSGVRVDLASSVKQDTGAGFDTILHFEAATGSAFSDRLSGGTGSEAFEGLAGADTFVFGSTFGNDVVMDFNTTEDVLEFSRASFADAAGVLAASRDSVMGWWSMLVQRARCCSEM